MQALGMNGDGRIGPGSWNGKGFSLKDTRWIKEVNLRWTEREFKNTKYEVKIRMDEFGNPIYEVYKNGKLDSEATLEYIALMAELRLRELDNFLNSPIGKVYITVVGMSFFYGGAKFIVKGIVDLRNGLAMAYGMNAETGQMIPVLVRSDGLVISEVIQSVSAGVAKAITGIEISAITGNGNFDSTLGLNGQDFDKIGESSTPEELVDDLENKGWGKVVEPPRGKSGSATILTDPKTGMKVRIQINPADGRAYFRVQNSGGGYLDSTGNFPSNASRQELRDLTHFYFK